MTATTPRSLMEILVNASKAAASVDLAHHARYLLGLALERRHADVQRVEVRLGDAAHIEAPRDAFCVIQLQVSGVGASTIVNISRDPHRAIEKAAERAGRLMEELLIARREERIGKCAAEAGSLQPRLS